ncbi:hypothetical protein [Streptomyces sp. NPDC046862]|uniref:hypothetical protein n=1 Tax=Streptomyces sp. NPDC046862 TaxID=3154603 RepID=UPI003456CB8F
MSDPVTPAAEAARALRDVERRREQAARTSQQESRWVSVVFAVLICAQLSAPDFFGDDVRPWFSWMVFALVAVYMVMLRTRRGAALLGRPTRVPTRELSMRFEVGARLVLIAAMVIALIASSLVDDVFPYAGTALGVLVGGTLIVFGPRLQEALGSVTVRGIGRGHSGGLDGSSRGSR